MGFPFRRLVRVIVSVVVDRVIVDHGVVDNRRGVVVVDNRRAVDVGDADTGVVPFIAEVVLLHDDRMSDKGEDADIHLHVEVVVPDHLVMMAAPPPVGIVRLLGSQGHPAHIAVPVDPRHPARVPVETDVKTRVSDIYADHRRRPVPATARIHPVPVMVGHIAERLGWNPGLVAIPLAPPSHRKRRPALRHIPGTPEGAIPSFIGHRLPLSVVVEDVGFIVEVRWQVLRRAGPGLGLLGPEGVASGVPAIPVRINGAVARAHLLGIGQE